MLSKGLSMSSVPALSDPPLILALCLGLSDRRDSASNPACLSSIPRINVEFLASCTHHINKPMSKQSMMHKMAL